jgi:membrane-associated protein
VPTTVALGPSFLNPDTLISDFGFLGLLLVIFAECGILIGIVLPGDSLLFTAGLLMAGPDPLLDQPLWLACLALWVAAVLGNYVGYMIGRRAGPAMFSRPNSRFFKQAYVERTAEFFEQFGGRSIVLARFVPIVRTLITFMAGAAKMDLRVFMTYSAIGGALWASGLTALGYSLGEVEFIEQNLEPVIVGIVALSFVPVFLHLRKERRKAKETAAEPAATPATPAAPTAPDVTD